MPKASTLKPHSMHTQSTGVGYNRLPGQRPDRLQCLLTELNTCPQRCLVVVSPLQRKRYALGLEGGIGTRFLLGGLRLLLLRLLLRWLLVTVVTTTARTA